MTPAHIRALRGQLGCSQQALADRVNEIDLALRLDRNAISRYERGGRSPSYRVELALAALWLHEGYPATATFRVGSPTNGVLTTNSSASSYGQPVYRDDDQAYGSAEVVSVSLGDAPPSIVDAVTRAGYVVAGS